MARLNTYYASDEVVPPIQDDPDTPDDALPALIEHLGKDDATARKALRLLDGIEAYPTCPAFPRLPEDDGLGLESFGERLSSLWATIKAWLRKVKQWLADDEYWVNLALRTLIFQAENLNVRGKTRLSTPRRGQFTLQSHINAVSVFYKPAPDIGTLITHLNHLKKLMGVYLGYTDQHMMAGVGRLSGRLQAMTLDPFDPTPLLDTLSQYNPRVLEGPLAMKPLRAVSGVLSSQHFLGNYRLLLDGPDAPTTLAHYNRMTLRMRYSEINPRPLPKQITMGYFGRLQHDQCTTQVIDFAKLLEAHTVASVRERKTRAIDDLTRAVDKLDQRVNETPEALQGHKEAMYEVVRLAKTVTDWVNNPHHGMITNALTSLRGALVVCRRNLQ